MNPLVLLCGQPNDPPLAAVQKVLTESDCTVVLLDRAAALEAEIELETGTSIAGYLRTQGKSFDLEDFGSVYLRPLEAENWSRTAPNAHLQLLQDILYSWADLTDALVLNRPTPMAANDSKPYQSAWLQALGFRVPETLLTTDPAEALAFWRRHGSVIYKSISGTRSIVSYLTEAHRDRLANVASCPTQFQQYIPGQDYRVHIVGDQVFPAAIRSQAVDYRYAPASFEATPCQLPDEIAALCLGAAKAMNLTLAGLDLRQTPDGNWFCFEVNPSPAFNCFDSPGEPIAKAVAQLLVNPKNEGDSISAGSASASFRQSL